MGDEQQENGYQVFYPKLGAVVNRLVGLEAGETITLQPLEGFTPESYLTELRKMVGQREEVEDRNYRFQAFKDRLIVVWEPFEMRKFIKNGGRDWSGIIRRASELKEGESFDITVPDNDDLSKYKANLTTTLGYNAKTTRNYRWGISHTANTRILVVTRYGLRSETPAQPPQAPPIVLPPPEIKPVQNPYDTVIADLQSRLLAIEAEATQLHTAISCLKSLRDSACNLRPS